MFCIIIKIPVITQNNIGYYSHPQPSQNRLAAGSTSRLLWEFDRLLAIRKCIILLTRRRKEKRKKNERNF